MAIVVGSVEVEVVPSTRTFAKTLRRELAPITQALGRDLGDEIGAGVHDGVKKAIPEGMRDAPVRQAGRDKGDEFGGAFGQAVQKSVAAALSNLPPVQIGAATSEADQKLRDLSARLASLRDARVGVDLDAGKAIAEIAALKAELAALGRDHVDIGVKLDTAKAGSALALFEVGINGVEKELTNLAGSAPKLGALDSVFTSIGESAGKIQPQMVAVVGVVGALATTLIPIAGAAAGAFGAIATGAIAALSGVGVLLLAFHGIADAIKAQGKAQQDAAKEAQQSAAAQAAAAKQVRSAYDGATSAAQGLADAQRRYSDAVTAAAYAAEAAARRVADAQRGVGDAQRQAAQQVAAAYANTIAAVDQLAEAQRRAEQAQKDLTQAREDEQKALRDLASQQSHNVLDIEQSQLDLNRAARDLAATNADPSATDEQRRQAQIDYDNAVLRLNDLKAQQSDLAAEKQKADMQGVDGSDRVEAALQGVWDAEKGIHDAQQNVATSATALSKAQSDGIRLVGDAQQRLNDALTEQGRSAQASAEQVLVAQQGVTTAQGNVARANQQVTDALVAQKAATDQVGTSAAAAKTAMDNLSPAGQAFATFVMTTLQPALKVLTDAAQMAFLPALQAGLEGIQPLVQPLSDFVTLVGTALGDAFTYWLNTLKDPAWTAFFGYLNNTIPGAIRGIGKFVSNIGIGLAAITTALGPFTQQIGGYLLTLSQRFAAWATNTDEKSSFQKFLRWLKANGPGIFKDLKDISATVFNLAIALAPYGKAVLDTIGLLARVMNAIPKTVIDNIVNMITLVPNTLNWLWQNAKSIGDAVGGIFETIWNWLQKILGPLGEVGDFFKHAGSSVGKAIGKITPWSAVPALAAGGIVRAPTLALVGESGPEAVVPLDKWSAMAAPSADQPPGYAPEVRVYIGNEELRGYVRTEIVQSDQANARQLNYGRQGR